MLRVCAGTDLEAGTERPGRPVGHWFVSVRHGADKADRHPVRMAGHSADAGAGTLAEAAPRRAVAVLLDAAGRLGQLDAVLLAHRHQRVSYVQPVERGGRAVKWQLFASGKGRPGGAQHSPCTFFSADQYGTFLHPAHQQYPGARSSAAGGSAPCVDSFTPVPCSVLSQA